jgi:oligopeptide/dipeptide ABC transporter ATP-binding protein
MYLGTLVEMADKVEMYNRPLHPYTQALLSSVSIPDPIKTRQRKRIPLSGELPSPLNPPDGCRFHPRCPIAESKCKLSNPQWREIQPGHWVACHLLAGDSGRGKNERDVQ